MHWPYIFFKAGKKNAAQEQSPAAVDPAKQLLKPASPESQPPAIKPVPTTATPPTVTTPPPQPKAEPPETGTRTLPAMHGVVLRPPGRTILSSGALPIGAASASARPTTPLKNIEQLMVEADPVRTLNQTGSVHMMKRQAPDSNSANVAPSNTTPPISSPGSEPKDTPIAPTLTATKSAPLPTSAILPPPKPPAVDMSSVPPPFPAFKPAGTLSAVAKLPEAMKGDSMPSPVAKPAVDLPPLPPTIAAPQASAKPVISANAASTDEIETPFILKPAGAGKAVSPTPPPPLIPLGSIFRRKAKMTEVARIVLPPKREETQPLHKAPEASSAVVPPAFPVAAMTKRASQPIMTTTEAAKIPPPLPVESIASEKIASEVKTPEPIPVFDSPKKEAAPPPFEKTVEAPVIESKPMIEVKPDVDSKPPTDNRDAVGDKTEVPPQETLAPVAAKSEKQAMPEKAASQESVVPPATPPPIPSPEPTTTSLFREKPKVDSEAHKPEPTPAPALPVTQLSTPETPREKREFHLANGERVAGVVLSETPDVVLIEHPSLGVISVPRNQIAKRLVEIILINGDRIVGDIMAETADTLYVRHASLGMLTVPRAQRSTRVVEAILKDGDRILGEVLTETDSFTVIRSATLGTITVPHSKISMLNRKIEQIELKALPPPPPEIKDKPAS
jgi:RNase P/RNase MRP subunit p29